MIGLRMDMKEGERKGEKGRQENSGREGQEERGGERNLLAHLLFLIDCLTALNFSLAFKNK